MVSQELSGPAVRGKLVTFILIVILWLLTGYLAWRSVQLGGPAEPGSVDLCRLIFGRSCDPTLSGRAAWQLGYPLANWGLIYFGLVGLLLAVGNRKTDLLALWISAFGVGVSVMLSIYPFASGLPFCPLCTAVHLLNLALLFSVWLTLKPYPADRSARPLTWTLLPLVMLAFGALTELIVVRSEAIRPARIDLAEVLARYDTAAVRPIPTDSLSARTGTVDAPVELVVFSSFQCPACKVFAASIQPLQEEFGARLSVVFKHFPLSTTCNPFLVLDQQPRACAGAAAAMAAHRQGRFWAYHDALFATDLSADEETLSRIAQELSLDLERWKADRHAAATADSIAQDCALGYQLGINATPSVFINGRSVENVRLPVLRMLIQKELSR